MSRDTLIRRAERVTVHDTWITFTDRDLTNLGGGYGFLLDEVTPEQAARIAALCDDERYDGPRIEHSTRRWLIPAIIRCACGRAVELHSAWANACDCDREYNGFGQRLAPRSQWGEETGERF